ncbi:MAG: hypothetical protein OXH83_06525 [Bryobacterales bacterium]|nr:hypothetical protein [Bryobacterales bacterium]
MAGDGDIEIDHRYSCYEGVDSSATRCCLCFVAGKMHSDEQLRIDRSWQYSTLVGQPSKQAVPRQWGARSIGFATTLGGHERTRID